MRGRRSWLGPSLTGAVEGERDRSGDGRSAAAALDRSQQSRVVLRDAVQRNLVTEGVRRTGAFGVVCPCPEASNVDHPLTTDQEGPPSPKGERASDLRLHL